VRSLPRRPASWRLLILQLLQLNVGLMLFGIGVTCMLRAGIGVGPWDVFHQGAALRSPLTVGQVMVAAGFAVLVFSMVVAKVRPGVATICNMALVGPWVDFYLASPLIPTARGVADGLLLFAVGMGFYAFATGLYITAGLGAGPRDGFVLGLSRLLETSIRRARTIIEVTVVATGWLLGGPVGIGTIIFALSIGPLMQASLKAFSGLDARYGAARAAALARRGLQPAVHRRTV
jgi:uncharacterized protein